MRITLGFLGRLIERLSGNEKSFVNYVHHKIRQPFFPPKGTRHRKGKKIVSLGWHESKFHEIQPHARLDDTIILLFHGMCLSGRVYNQNHLKVCYKQQITPEWMVQPPCPLKIKTSNLKKIYKTVYILLWSPNAVAISKNISMQAQFFMLKIKKQSQKSERLTQSVEHFLRWNLM